MNLLKEKRTFLLISPEGWGDNMLSKHHYATELANLGHNVYFLNPPGCQSKDETSPNSSNLKVITHWAIKGTSRLPGNLSRLVQSFEIKMILKKMKTKPDIVWSFDPYRLQWLRDFGAKITIYHAVDNHFTPREKIIEHEADLVFSNAESILKKLTSKKKYLIKHGLASHFINPDLVEVQLPGTNKIKAGYIGNLANTLIDFKQLEQAIVNNPMVDFYFIGPKGKSNLSNSHQSENFERVIESKKNAYYLGPKSTFLLPSYLNLLDILILAYKQDRSGFTVNPHKLLEYLSSGKIIIATLMGEFFQGLDELIERVPESGLFSQHFEKVLRDLQPFLNDDKIKRRKEIAFNNSYSVRLHEIFDIIERSL